MCYAHVISCTELLLGRVQVFSCADFHEPLTHYALCTCTCTHVCVYMVECLKYTLVHAQVHMHMCIMHIYMYMNVLCTCTCMYMYMCVVNHNCLGCYLHAHCIIQAFKMLKGNPLSRIHVYICLSKYKSPSACP